MLRRFAIALLSTALLVPFAPALQASAASGPTGQLTQKQVRNALLTLPQVGIVSMIPDMSAEGFTCHHAPYYKEFVDYCYYEVLHSPSAYKAGREWPNHADIITFEKPSTALRYVKETIRDRTTSKLLYKTPNKAVFYDEKLPVIIPAKGEGDQAYAEAPSVSVFAAEGFNAVYTACVATDSKVTVKQLTACAENLATVQFAKLRARR